VSPGRSFDLPPVPRDAIEDGGDWLDGPDQGWRAVPAWGHDGWDLLEWPYAAAAHFDDDELYGLAVYEEGDVAVTGYRTSEDRDAATDRIAVQYWRANGRGPGGLPDSDDELAPHHLGAFSIERCEREVGKETNRRQP